MSCQNLDKFKQKITITIDGYGSSTTFSTTDSPLTKPNVLDWFEFQVLPALGYSANIPEGEIND